MNVPSTAIAIAFIRAAEARLPQRERLFDDPWATHFAGDVEGDAVRAVFEGIPFFREAIRLRTRFFDDEIRREVAAGARAVVLLGSGFDTRALRMPELEGVPVYEVDVASQHERKRDALGRAGVAWPTTVRSVSADLSQAELAPALRRAGLDAATRAVVIAEGLVGYLDRATLDATLLGAHLAVGAGSLIALNHHAVSYPPEVLRGALEAAGWSQVEQPSFVALHREWIGTAAPDGGDAHHLARARR